MANTLTLTRDFNAVATHAFLKMVKDAESKYGPWSKEQRETFLADCFQSIGVDVTNAPPRAEWFKKTPA